MQPTQGSSFLATLGLRTQSRWDWNVRIDLNAHPCRESGDMSPHSKGRSPADWLSGVLLIEPRVEWGEVIEDCGRVHLALAGQGFERVRPWPGQSAREHLLELGAGGFAAVDGSAMQRATGAGSGA